ncbi:MAG: hypothetical protein NTX35_14040 [Verrucomicrobia bacterium]|nr:hypothetical protein [Verrucomicrobiota bacterium]
MKTQIMPNLFLGVAMLCFLSRSASGASVADLVEAFPPSALTLGMTMDQAKQAMPSLSPMTLSPTNASVSKTYIGSHEHGALMLAFEKERLASVVAVWPGTPIDQAMNVATQLRAALRKQFGTPKEFNAGRLHVSDYEPLPLRVEIFESQNGVQVLFSATSAEVSLNVLDPKLLSLKNFYQSYDEAVESSKRLKSEGSPASPPKRKIKRPVDFLAEASASSAANTSAMSVPQQQPALSKPPPVVQPPTPKKKSDEKSATQSEKSASTPWSIIVVLIVAATGLLWLLVKKRK